MNIEFKNRVIFLTGGSRGIGKKIKEVFEKNGAEVIAPEREELDLSSIKSVEHYLKHNNLNIDIFIHCAGINEIAGIEEIGIEMLNKVFQVNYNAPVMLLNDFVASMKKQKHGKIVFISSLYAMVSRERRVAYSSSKSALTGLTKTLALELAPYDIMVNAVAPGYVMTDMTRQNLTQLEICEIEKNLPTGRFQTEEEIANTVAFLCSDLNSSITGQLLAIDGGFTCR